jgi:protein-S-isoprenylcysteine O-methyltransferase Ste14
MYVALALTYIGAAVALVLPWGLLLLPLLLIYTQTMVIAREEAYLADAFGQDFANYKTRVRRWL